MDQRGSEVERRKIAAQLAKDIRLANLLAKQNGDARRKRFLYKLKHKKVSLLISDFSEHCRLIAVEITGTGTLLLIGLPGGYGVHVPYEKLTEAAREAIRSILGARLNTNPPVPLAA